MNGTYVIFEKLNNPTNILTIADLHILNDAFEVGSFDYQCSGIGF